jgi:hypothetical protein
MLSEDIELMDLHKLAEIYGLKIKLLMHRKRSGEILVDTRISVLAWICS